MMLNRRHLLAGLGVLLLPRLGRAQAAPVAPTAAPFDATPLIEAARLGGDVAFLATDLANGTVLASRHAETGFAPASTLKIVTALYALEKLGSGHRFVTKVWREGETLILAGGGDPVLDSDGLAMLAANTVANWHGAPPKRFLVWGGALPRAPRLSTVQDEYLPYNPAISGLNLNFNRVHLGWRQGKMSLEARGRHQSPRAYTVSVSTADRRLPLFTYDASGKREAWTVSRAAVAKSGSRWLPVRRPELYAGDVFQTLCRAKGLVLPAPEVSDAPPSGAEIARIESATLAEIARDMLEYSTNLTAEVIGIAASGAPSSEASATAMAEWLHGLLPGQDFAFRDHSGLSAENRLSAAVLARLVAQEGDRRGLRGLLKHIPLRDKDGRTKDSRIEVLAKTGTLNFVSNLAGYAQLPDGRSIAFAILTADEPRRAASEGRERPEGVSSWIRRSKTLQQALIEDWMTRLPA